MSNFVRAKPTDAAAVRLLVRSAYAKWVAVTGREPLPMTADYESAIKNHIIDMIMMNGEIIGLIELVPEQDCVLIENVAVKPSEWGKGYGRTLMTHAIDVAHLLKRNRIRLYTNKLMAQNISMYQKLGYTIDRVEKVPDRGEAVHMSKDV